MDKRTIYPMLARPIGRTEYLAGRYLGVVLTLGLNVAAMGVLYGLLIRFLVGTFTAAHVAALYLIGIELAVLAAFSTLFSVISSPALGGLFTLAVFFVGHLAEDVQRFAVMLPRGSMRSLVRAAGLFIPNLELFNVKGIVVYGKPVGIGLVFWASTYAAGIILATLVVAAVAFRRKDLR
jgi:ABC-type transport system involved in multi-copper enzyme maturation permease subunit